MTKILQIIPLGNRETLKSLLLRGDFSFCLLSNHLTQLGGQTREWILLEYGMTKTCYYGII